MTKRRAAVLAAIWAGTPLAAACDFAETARLPIIMRGLQPMAPATINGEPMELLLDSGGFYTMISRVTADRLKLGLVKAMPGFQASGIGGASPTAVARVRELTVGTMTEHGIDVLVGGNADVIRTGIIGQNMLGRRDADYDLSGGMVRLIEPRGCRAEMPPWMAGAPVSSIPLEKAKRGRHVVAIVYINKIAMRAVFDSGAETTILTRAAAAKAGVTPESAGSTVGPAGRGIGGTVASWIGRFDSIKVGGEEARGVKLRFAEIQGFDFDLLIGADYFLTHRIYVANAARRMYVMPRLRLVPIPVPVPAGDVH